MYYGLTYLGVFHTILSFIALGVGAVALIRDGKIDWGNMTGKIYVITTIIVCLTGFGIFQHGGFGKPHALGVVTLIVLVVAFAAGAGKFGRFSPYVKTVSFSMTFFFHIIPTLAEGATRLPYGAPLVSSPEDPRIQMATGVCFVLFLIGATIQVRKLRAKLQAGAINSTQ